jgi:hypothetical protein
MGYIVDDVIVQVEAEIKKLQARHESLINLTHTQRLAIELNIILDAPGSGWGWEIKDGIHDWDKPVHKDFLKRAEALYELVSANTNNPNVFKLCVDFVKAAKGKL